MQKQCKYTLNASTGMSSLSVSQALPIHLVPCEKDYLQVEKIQDRSQSMQDFMSQEEYPEVRPCNAQRNCKRKEERKKRKSYISVQSSSPYN